MNTHAHSTEPQHAYRLSAPTLTIYLLGLLVLVLGVVGTMRIMLHEPTPLEPPLKPLYSYSTTHYSNFDSRPTLKQKPGTLA